MRHLHIGTPVDDRRRNFTLPESLVTLTTAVLGIRGSGKTVTASVIAEELLERGHQVLIIDPTDAWWGLKSSVDGREEGYPITVLGGPHGNLPLKASDGRVLADFAVERQYSMILSLRHLRKGKQRTFVTDFAEQLYHRKGELEHRTPVLVIIDEASTYVPQRVGSGEARMVGAIEDLVRRGRNAGIGLCAIDQRPASVNKDVLTQLEVLVAHRVTSPQDRKAIDEWVRQHDTHGHRDEFLDALSTLGTGEAWFWAPALGDLFEQVQVRMRHTYDSSQTPKHGEELQPPEAVAEVDLEALREQLQETIEEAEANDPKALRARIAELEKDNRDLRQVLSEVRAAEESRTDVDVDGIRAEVREELLEDFTGRLHEHLAEAIRAGVEVAGERLRPLVEDLQHQLAAAETAIDAIAETVDEQLPEVLGHLQEDPPMPEDLKIGGFDTLSEAPRREVTTQRRRVTKQRSELTTQQAARRGSPATAGDLEITPPRRRILGALAALAAIGVDVVSRTNLAVWARQSPKSSAYQAHVAKLEQAGLVRYPAAGHVALTPEGGRVAGPADPPRSVAELHDRWREYLPDAQWRIVEVLVDLYPADVGREELAPLSDQSPKSSAYQANVATLEQLGLARYPGPGRVAATDLLFPEGLR